MTGSITLSDTALGYQRDAELQRRFTSAATRLRELDGWPNPRNGGLRELRADLALEGGGVKGIGLVGSILVLTEAGYTFRGVAGTSAGAVTACLVAGLQRAGQPMTRLLGFTQSLDFLKFMPNGKIHDFLDHVGGHAGNLAADAAILTTRSGIYSGNYLEDWLRPILHDDLGVRTFGDLKLSDEDDPDLSLPEGQRYSLMVQTADITRGQLARLPWDYPRYGHDPDAIDPVSAVRASMSIPFFFEPVQFISEAADVSVPTAGGRSAIVHYEAGSETWVDGGLLENFPITAFERDDGEPARWPTIGIKLSQLQTSIPKTESCESSLAVALRCLHTMMNEWDSYSVDAGTAARTIFIDNAGINAIDFDLTQDQKNELFLNGVEAATQFILDMADAGGVPRR
jgi:NTE family protein